ncbi:snaclec 1-like isoform X1 [Dreissena polymorpha]|uniref:snaclec 1-like isoform X1 n=1 Tax=Dreissena polymorpha TaxID=45954 RepID=UPI00226453DF|nr:snaclec 1-like isoform X1 [Dreissena polymorpha]
MRRGDMMTTSQGLFVTVCWILMTNGGAVCPDGYCRHSDGCYRTVALNVTWIDARSYCEVLGGHLLSPVSQSMAAAAEGALRRMKGTIFPGKFWIDITDLLNPKDWKRMSDKKALNFTNWDTTSGTGTSEVGARNCVYMSESLDYKWVPASCIETINFLCYHAGLPPTTERYVAGTTRLYHKRRGWSNEDIYDYRDISPADVDC